MPTLYQIQFSVGPKVFFDIYMFNGSINMKQKSTLDLIPVPNWYERFWKIPNTNNCQVWKKITHKIECVIPT
jgi:hypothetical protein